MNIFVDILIGLIGATLVLADRANYVIDENGVKVVNVQRFGGNMMECDENMVCADVFNFNRTLEDGSTQPESRFIQNCRCPDVECGDPAYDPLIFHETRKQHMITCSPRQAYPTCGPSEIAKIEERFGRGVVFFSIHCVCPNNENPGSFRNKMTVLERNSGRQRLYKCRPTN